jgi:hypothetical protein
VLIKFKKAKTNLIARKIHMRQRWALLIDSWSLAHALAVKKAKRRQRKNKCMIGRTRHVLIPPII